jgi:hypothetical protein
MTKKDFFFAKQFLTVDIDMALNVDNKTKTSLNSKVFKFKLTLYVAAKKYNLYISFFTKINLKDDFVFLFSR